MSPVFLVLPYPPASNTLYGHRVVRARGRAVAVPYKTHAHRDYCEAAGRLVVTPWPANKRLAVSLRLYRPRRIGDIDGPIKTLFDALNGRAWVDDSQVVELHVQRLDDKARPRVEVSIREWSPDANSLANSDVEVDPSDYERPVKGPRNSARNPEAP